MAKERTLAIIKPEAREHRGAIIAKIFGWGFRIAVLKDLTLTPKETAAFYAEHTGKPFFEELCHCMSLGPITVMILEKEKAIAEWRNHMGATDPQKAEPGTLRHTYGFLSQLPKNMVHGSDSPESAEREIIFFFPSQ